MSLHSIQGFIQHGPTTLQVDLQRLSEQQRSKVASGQLSLQELLECAVLAIVPLPLPKTQTRGLQGYSGGRPPYTGGRLCCSYIKKDTPTGVLGAP